MLYNCGMALLDTKSIYCPYCGESIEIQIDLTVSKQEYIEDCQVCCRPITINVDVQDSEEYYVNVQQEDDI